MTTISEVLGASEDLSKVSEDFHHLERCYESISDSVSAAVAEVFAELSQLEQGGTLASTKAKVLSAIKELKIPITIFRQNQKQLSIISDRLKEIEAQFHASELKSDFEGPEEIEKLKETVALVRKNSVLVYTLLTESVHESWNYFPIELHQVFEDLADHADCRQEIDSDIAAPISVETKTAAKNFVHSIRKAVEENKLKPKWQLYTQQKVLPRFVSTDEHPHEFKFQELEDTKQEGILKGVRQPDERGIFSDSTVEPEQPQRSIDTAIVVNEKVWNRGERMIALASGGAFLGGLIAQVPGAAIGAVAGAIFGWLERSEETNATEN